MILGTKTQQPGEVLDWDIDCSGWLSEDDSIIDATVKSIDPIGLTATTVINGDRVKLWVQDGTDGITYKVTVTITTSGGRVKEVEVRFKIKEV